jgi:hypothetical protein
MRCRSAENPAGTGPRDVTPRARGEGVLRQEGQIQVADFTRSTDTGRPESTDRERAEFGSIIAVLVRPEQSHARKVATATDRTRQ